MNKPNGRINHPRTGYERAIWKATVSALRMCKERKEGNRNFTKRKGPYQKRIRLAFLKNPIDSLEIIDGLDYLSSEF